MKYIDLIAYPIAMVAVYVLLGILHWDKDPQTWDQGARAFWLCWGLAWGWGLQCRVARGGSYD